MPVHNRRNRKAMLCITLCTSVNKWWFCTAIRCFQNKNDPVECYPQGRFRLSKSPSPPPGGGWPRRGRERNAGINLKVCTAKQTCSEVGHRIQPRSRSSHFLSSNVTARIPLQSENRFRRADFLTASPREKRLGAAGEKRLGAAAPERSLTD